MDETITNVIDNMREQGKEVGLPHKVELTQEEKEAIINSYNRIAERITPAFNKIINVLRSVINNLKPALEVLIKLKQEEQARAIHRAKIQSLKKKRNRRSKLKCQRSKQ